MEKSGNKSIFARRLKVFYHALQSLVLGVVEKLIQLPRNIRQALLLCLDMLFVPLSIWLAAMLGQGRFHAIHPNDVLLTLLTMGVSAILFLRLGLYRAVIRYMGQQAMVAIMKAITFSALALAVFSVLTMSTMPVTTPFLYWCVALLLIGGSRLVIRICYQIKLRGSSDSVVIYGAGESGRQLLTALHHGGQFEAVFFVDDDPNLTGTVINGVSVIQPAALPTIVREYGISQILLAMPRIDAQRRREIINKLVGLPVCIRTVPTFSDIVHGHIPIAHIQDISIEDLLGREPVPPHPELLAKCIRDKVVLVTGAGGSIGGELCRQIAQHKPRQLILFEISEFALYTIERELRDMFEVQELDIDLVPLLGSVQDYDRLVSIFSLFHVHTVYHAAAYKHVPMVEYNIVEGVRNNTIGTYRTAMAAIEAQVSNFVLISTDKAVRPTNVMGASKRLAEMVLQAMSGAANRTHFCMVRFGNVLGSSGSVVPLFREQIKNGGPVTVTHPEVIRFFMTAEEAAHLVLQAGAMGRSGEVFVLEMGEPVKIMDLARRMIMLAGHEVKDADYPHGDIEISITGLRRGEKLYEELLLGNNVTGTGHPKILRAEEEFMPFGKLRPLLEDLDKACQTYNCKAVQEILRATVKGFKPENGLSDRVWDSQQNQLSNARGAKVSVLYPEKDATLV